MASMFDPKKKSAKSVARKAFDNLAVTGLIAAGGIGVAMGGVYVWDKASQSTDTRTVNQIEEIKTEICTKVTSTITTGDTKAKPQAQQKSYVCESTSEFVNYTNDGNYDNSPNRLRFKSEGDVKELQDKIHVGDTLDFKVSGFQLLGKENLLDVQAATTAASAAADNGMKTSTPAESKPEAAKEPEGKTSAEPAATKTPEAPAAKVQSDAPASTEPAVAPVDEAAAPAKTPPAKAPAAPKP